MKKVISVILVAVLSVVFMSVAASAASKSVSSLKPKSTERSAMRATALLISWEQETDIPQRMARPINQV